MSYTESYVILLKREFKQGEKMRRLFIFIVLQAFCNSLILLSGEGMWLPYLLGENNINIMRGMGLEISAEDIFSNTEPSIKDAIVLFDRGCTGEIISDSGLLVTNYHCAYSYAQAISTTENDYMTDGYWAETRNEEIPLEDLTVSLLVSVDDVTDKVLKNIDPGLNENVRSRIINQSIDSISALMNASEDTVVKIVPFYYGNEYYMFVYQVFRDIRLVGIPPGEIGRFGGETDNWVWPRHTGDFALFRIYADSSNNPAEYSHGNLPYKPVKHLHISLKGYSEGDFTMTYGYPARTYQFLTSHAIRMLNNSILPQKIKFREERQKIIKAAMDHDSSIKLKYAAKYESMSNALKKWTGILEGFERIEIIRQKEELESQFNIWADTDPALKDKYGALISEFEKLYEQLLPLNAAGEFFYETMLSTELINFVTHFGSLLLFSETNSTEAYNQDIENLKKEAGKFFRDYSAAVDEKIFASMLGFFYYNVDRKFHPGIIDEIFIKNRGDFSRYASYLYSKSIFTDKTKVDRLLGHFSMASKAKIENDPAFQIYNSFFSLYKDSVIPCLNTINIRMDSLFRLYVKGLAEMEPHRQFYPDANHTLRLSYGKIEGYRPEDAVTYSYYTTLAGVIEKSYYENQDYAVPGKLRELYKLEDYGRYATDSIMHVCFIAANHTSGGSSGSPVLNSEGNLIGINFDRNWEGTMSDYIYDRSICRNISLDVRYMLFIIDKYAGAQRLLDEMTIVY
jgi:hypothetical protein